ncbi:MAG: YlcI/YnfO family protein [Candidatus Nanoperiomorbaceae bacterium]
MKNSKITIYLPTELAKTAKKHVVDTDETLSAFVERAVQTQLKEDDSRSGKKKLLARQKTEELDDIIGELSK